MVIFLSQCLLCSTVLLFQIQTTLKKTTVLMSRLKQLLSTSLISLLHL